MYANLAHIAKQTAMMSDTAYNKLKVLKGDELSSDRPSELNAGSAWLTLLSALLEVARPEEEGYWKNFSSSRRLGHRR